jgi:glycosyltransferase involved in cell wall biosynthesis
MFGWEYPPRHSGGLGVACQGLVRGLMHHGVQVTLVLPSAGGKEDGIDIRFPTSEQLRTVYVQSSLQPYDSFDSFSARTISTRVPMDRINELYGPDLGNAVESFTALAVDMTKDVHSEVVHCHDWMTYEAGLIAGKHHQKPVVAHVHATELDRTDFHPNPWIAERERSGLLRADHVVAVSGYTKNMLQTHYGISERKISVVHNGHDHNGSQIRPTLIAKKGNVKRPLILFLGRLTVQKNPWQFLEIAHRVRLQRPDAQFVMAGDGAMMETLIERACALGLQDSLIFTGKVNSKEAQSLYSAADCFVMPSISEPFGLVALEAIAHGTPVIISKQSGVAEVLDHAFKVNYWDTDLMTDCILTILREEPLARQLRTEAPRLLNRLSWKNQAASVQSIYQNLINF